MPVLTVCVSCIGSIGAIGANTMSFPPELLATMAGASVQAYAMALGKVLRAYLTSASVPRYGGKRCMMYSEDDTIPIKK